MDHAARAFDTGIGVDAEKVAQRQVEDLYAKINLDERELLARERGCPPVRNDAYCFG